jgi:hypothetical protein
MSMDSLNTAILFSYLDNLLTARYPLNLRTLNGKLNVNKRVPFSILLRKFSEQ